MAMAGFPFDLNMCFPFKHALILYYDEEGKKKPHINIAGYSHTTNEVIRVVGICEEHHMNGQKKNCTLIKIFLKSAKKKLPFFCEAAWYSRLTLREKCI